MTIFRHLMIATLLGIGLYARNAEAQPDCDLWNSEGFFESAAAADVRRCLAAGAEVEARTEGGETPLHLAALGGNAETVTALVDAGADVEAREEDNRTPLHVAAAGGTAETVTALVKAGADVEAREEDNRTPLHWAALSGNAETVAALVKAGANIRAKTSAGSLPADSAEYNDKVKNHDIFQVLDAARRE
ncbi:MAG: ankyrin repeat domain-containing protein [Hyphomonadaceae bacterium]|nr:ankyrin repeat domain-containing protein [Hyphomonadaceae bacterium]MBC6411962.1 ankyrin repeat domain-containing protein [Hyphomonadaceae bacterium]